MNKRIILISLSVLTLAFAFTSCKKTNVKFADKKIIGTWTLTAEEYTSSDYSKHIFTYSPTTDCYTNNTQESTDSYTSNFDGTNNTITISEKDVYIVGTDTETDQFDTTYTEVNENTFEITFFEDGTCKIATTYDENDSPDFENWDGVTYWNWVDAKQDKMGIEVDGYLWVIEELTKDQLIITLITDENGSGEYSNDFYCFDYETFENIDVVQKDVYTGNEKSTDKMTFTKKEE